jgi:lipoprotein NlpI
VGVLLAQGNKLDCAIAAFDADLHLNSRAWDARYNKGLALISNQKYERAAKELLAGHGHG